MKKIMLLLTSTVLILVLRLLSVDILFAAYEDGLVHDFTTAEGYNDNTPLSGLGWTVSNPDPKKLYIRLAANAPSHQGNGLSFDSGMLDTAWAMDTLPITLGSAGTYYTFHINIGTAPAEENPFTVSLQNSEGAIIAGLQFPEVGGDGTRREVSYWVSPNTYTPSDTTSRITENSWATITLLFGVSGTYSLIVNDITNSVHPVYTGTIVKEKFTIGGTGALGGSVYIDAIYVNPEPATCFMFISSLLGLGWKMRRRMGKK